jgi:hypothetical protein
MSSTTRRPPRGSYVPGFSAMTYWQLTSAVIRAEIERLERDPRVHPAYADELRGTLADIEAAGREFAEWCGQRPVAANGNRPRQFAGDVSTSERPPLLDTREVAERLGPKGPKERRVRQLCQSGLLPATNKGGRWWVDPAALEIYIATRKGAA